MTHTSTLVELIKTQAEHRCYAIVKKKTNKKKQDLGSGSIYTLRHTFSLGCFSHIYRYFRKTWRARCDQFTSSHQRGKKTFFFDSKQTWENHNCTLWKLPKYCFYFMKNLFKTQLWLSLQLSGCFYFIALNRSSYALIAIHIMFLLFVFNWTV